MVRVAKMGGNNPGLRDRDTIRDIRGELMVLKKLKRT